METLWQDIRFGFRSLATSPAFTLVAMLSLALGIGANTAIFTVTNTVFLSPIPVQEPSRLMRIETSDRFTKSSIPALDRSPVSILNYQDFRAQNDVFTDVAAFIPWGVTKPSTRGSRRRSAVIVINQAAARTFFPGEQAVGKRLKFLSEEFMREVVGVCGDTVTVTIGESPQPVIYVPLAQDYQPFLSVDVRTKTAPEALLPAAIAEVHRLNSSLALAVPQTIQQLIGTGLWAPRMGAALFGIFGALGLLLAAIGIYGVMAYMVAQRTNEIGIRMALGAARADVLGLVVQQALRLAFAGIVIGVVGGLLVTRLMSNLLFNVSPADPLTYSAVSLVLATAAFAAAWIPAWRASGIDPVTALRD